MHGRETVPKFKPGRVFATPGVMERTHEHVGLFGETDPKRAHAKTQRAALILSDLVDRHVRGDWCDDDMLCQEDRDANEHAVKHGLRTLSAYMIGTVKVWVITEADRSSTTILLPEEY